MTTPTSARSRTGPKPSGGHALRSVTTIDEFDLARNEQRTRLLDYERELLAELPRVRSSIPPDDEELSFTFDETMTGVDGEPVNRRGPHT